MLADRYEVLLQDNWQGEVDADLMIALHARRSAAAMEAWGKRAPGKPLIVVLTGTDVYRDIHHDAAAQRSLGLATRLVVLQAAALDELEPALRERACVIVQSAPSRTRPSRPPDSAFTAIMIGHLREEKMPQTFMQAAALLVDTDVQMRHVGRALEAEFERMATDTAQLCPHYQWLGPLPHPDTLNQLAMADVMVIASRMEGGANVIIEAVTCDVPVLASDISGNRGMLGNDYQGYFPLGDSVALAGLLRRCAQDASFLESLRQQCERRAPLFAPGRESAALRQLVDNELALKQDPT